MFRDPHFHARGLFEEVTVDGESLKIPAILPRLGATPGRTDWPGPELGAHNLQVYGELLGLSEDEVERLGTDGII
jgi:crotonobetainyl-CoA:carnitine CoA-transferase CaiB-like acyl-CoA transferase